MSGDASKSCRPDAPVLRRGGFQLAGRVFGASPTGLGRVDGSRLQELFFPERLRLKRDQKRAAEDAKNTFKKPFFAAQLRWYGIPFRSSAVAYELEGLLKDAVVSGQCKEPPASVIQLEQAMRRDHESALRSWDQAVADWETRKKTQADEAWAKCSTPAEQAEQDLNRFVAHYFLTDGAPDPAKTPEPMALYGFGNRSQLHAAAERIRGLETTSGGEGDTRTICIGWDRSAVWRLAGEVGSESRRRETSKADEKWAARMKDHERLVQQVRNAGPYVHPKNVIEPPALRKSRGSYIIRCEQVAGEWPSPLPFTLDVMSGPAFFVAAGHLDLGFFEGTMLFSLDDDRLENYITGEDSEDEDDSEEVDDDFDQDVGSKRKSAPSKAKSAPAKRPRGRPPKKGKTPAHRVFIRLRGRETGEGEIQPDPRDGYLDFSDEYFTKFSGQVDLPYLSGTVKLEGFKVSTSAQRRYSPWSSFSEAAYERARVSRWR